ncbi:Retrovirus-related Pol polyprotein from transposon RE1 [Vitis vinifera]|uniref:Retrovirus-related Pol polyprotein from transposon RE1 n=1 Tax=Vitis vinifera TaxID=29760 RepID=A0A438FA99_VITVI|nr:Retrovirus-related Pol polyprotein from transposon RE1 [Vitis vinifera]
MMLVSKPLNGDNYSTWYRTMMISLNAKSKIGFIDGTTTMSSATTKPDDYASWKKCNDMVLSWILNSLTQDLQTIERDIACLAQDQMIVAAYYTRLKKLWDELGSYNDTICSCGVDHKRRKLMQFLMGLNESYNAIRGQILLMNPLPDVAKAYSSIVQEEKQRSLGLHVRRRRTQPWLFKGLNRWGCSTWTRSNQRSTHFKRNNSHQPSVNNVKEGPMMQEVPLVTNGLSDLQILQILSIMQGKGTTQSANSKADVVGTSSGLLQTLLRLYQLIIDSGAIDHITSSPTLLVNSSKNTRLPPVAMPSKHAPITSIGNLPLNSNITLKNVLGVPSFKVDLMSVSRGYQRSQLFNNLLSSLVYFIGLDDEDDDWLGEQRDRLYYLVALASEKPKSQTPSIATTSCRSPSHQVISSTVLWHCRLGHLSSSRLHFMAKHLLKRKHRHILETARAFRFQAHLPLHFWVECVSTAIHIINRLPTPLLSRQTPFERLYGKLPSYSHLRVFGCLAYATDVHVPHKFAPRAKRCIFLGYPADQKAYKLYDLATHKMFASRDVVFHETIFPYESISSISSNSSLVVPLSISDSSPPEPVSPVQQPTPPNPISFLQSPTSPPREPILRRSQRPHILPRFYVIMSATK